VISTSRLLLTGFFALGISGCDVLLPDLPADEDVLDGPIDGLTPTQLAVHIEGDEAFGRSHSVTRGVGPAFNATGCIQCHVGEGKGHLIFNLTRFGRSVGGAFDPMRASGGPQLQNRAVPGHVPESLPDAATGVAEFMPPSVTGLGYLEAVDDTTLMRLADPDDMDGDGISGRLQLVDAETTVAEIAALEAVAQMGPPTRGTVIDGKFIGRFGRKASAVNLLHQTVTAYLQDMGLTTDILPRDLFHPGIGNFAEDAASDPEVSSSEVNAVVFYLKTLKVPPRRNADDPEILVGEQLFREVGCAGCHLPALTTGRSEIPQLDRVTFHPYTDLLLHDMGPELDDGYTEGRAATSEWRTTPLWGVGLSAEFQGGQGFFMHDGRARSLTEAIELHGGEASASRDAFRALSEEDRALLIRFLESL